MQYDIYKDRANEWRWRAVAANGRKVADSAEGYASKENAQRALAAFRAANAGATVRLLQSRVARKAAAKTTAQPRPVVFTPRRAAAAPPRRPIVIVDGVVRPAPSPAAALRSTLKRPPQGR